MLNVLTYHPQLRSSDSQCPRRWTALDIPSTRSASGKTGRILLRCPGVRRQGNSQPRRWGSRTCSEYSVDGGRRRRRGEGHGQSQTVKCTGWCLGVWVNSMWWSIRQTTAQQINLGLTNQILILVTFIFLQWIGPMMSPGCVEVSIVKHKTIHGTIYLKETHWFMKSP